jgi:hypothetical protein
MLFRRVDPADKERLLKLGEERRKQQATAPTVLRPARGIIGLAKPAERRELPPLMDPPDQITINKVFNNYWCAEARDGWALSRLGIR